jgi:hypothetical protein
MYGQSITARHVAYIGDCRVLCSRCDMQFVPVTCFEMARNSASTGSPLVSPRFAGCKLHGQKRNGPGADDWHRGRSLRACRSGATAHINKPSAAATVPVSPFALTTRATLVSFPAFSHLPRYSRSARGRPPGLSFAESPTICSLCQWPALIGICSHPDGLI